MTDKEILAGLKSSYEKLYDIRENGSADHCTGQLNSNLIKQLEKAKLSIEDIYYEFYKTLDKESLRVKRLEDGDNKVYIASDVSFDYESNGYDLTCAETEYYWYEDKNFLNDKILTNDIHNFYAKVWITEYDREQGISDEYYNTFDNLKDAIENLRKLFDEGSYVCIELYDSSDNLYYSRDKESEDFYINDVKITKVNEELLGKYIDNWINHGNQPINDKLLYCENDNGIFTAIDNRSHDCFTEDFQNENQVFDWFFNEYEMEI